MTNEPNEIICTCGHPEMMHGTDGCLVVVHGDKICRCGMVSEGILRATVASLAASVSEKDRVIGELRNLLNLAGYTTHCKCLHCNSVRALLAETAPTEGTDE